MKQCPELSRDSKKLWLGMWRCTRFGTMPLWDDLCELVYNLLEGCLTGVRDKTVLEMGSGTGRVSLKLAREGAKVVLLDISSDIIKFSKSLFENQRLEGVFVVGDIFHLPFRNATLDVCWSSGVLEHYTRVEQKKAYIETMRVLGDGGSLIVIVPNREALVYNLFRNLEVKLGKWRFGYEEPLSPEELCLFPSKPILHHSAGFIYQLHFISLPLLGPALNVGFKFLSHIFPILKKIDMRLPGYLLSGLWRKEFAQV